MLEILLGEHTQSWKVVTNWFGLARIDSSNDQDQEKYRLVAGSRVSHSRVLLPGYNVVLLLQTDIKFSPVIG